MMGYETLKVDWLVDETQRVLSLVGWTRDQQSAEAADFVVTSSGWYYGINYWCCEQAEEVGIKFFIPTLKCPRQSPSNLDTFFLSTNLFVVSFVVGFPNL